MIKDGYIYLKLVLLIIFGFLMIILFKIYQNIFNIKIIGLLIISYIIFICGVIFNEKISFLGYLMALFTILFYRKQINNNVTDMDYIKVWINYLFSNKIIFINVFGNLVLYMPFIYYLNKFFKNIKIAIIVVFIFIVCGEYVQYLLKIGVFDLVDIIINTIGVLIYGLEYEVYIWIKKIRMT